MKKSKIWVMLLVIAIGVCALTACTHETESDIGFWFSDNSDEFVVYDENANGGSGNLEAAGTFYYFTSAKIQTITMSIRIDTDMFSSVYCYINDEQIKSENEVGIYSFVYKDIELKKGDKLKLHRFSTNTFSVGESKTEIQLMAINDFLIKEFDHSEAA